MHLLPAERAGHRIIDPEKVCEAIEGLGDPAQATAWARRFALLADPTRLRLLLAIKAAGPISVSDLAAATGITDVTVSQTLRHLRASGTVTTERDGRIIRYQLHAPVLGDLLGQVTPPRRAPGRGTHPGAGPARP
ncbi:MAG: metalloregulator ArsR/SmtB family transcription factor [Streptosporangiaceae bacterium]|jgi:DNA-binding transcriptional ArsR family regulator